MLGGIDRTVGTLAVRQSGPVGQCAPGLGDHLEIRPAETDREPLFRAIAELESVFELEAQVFFTRHRRPIVMATPGKSHRNSLSKNRPSSRAKSNCYPMAVRRGIRCAKSGVTRWLICFLVNCSLTISKFGEVKRAGGGCRAPARAPLRSHTERMFLEADFSFP